MNVATRMLSGSARMVPAAMSYRPWPVRTVAASALTASTSGSEQPFADAVEVSSGLHVGQQGMADVADR